MRSEKSIFPIKIKTKTPKTKSLRRFDLVFTDNLMIDQISTNGIRLQLLFQQASILPLQVDPLREAQFLGVS